MAGGGIRGCALALVIAVNLMFKRVQTIGICAWALLSLPAGLLAAEGSADRWGLLYGAGRFLNLALVAAVLVWAARKPLANFFAARSESIREQLAEAQKAREDAEARLAEIEAKMSRLEDAVRAIQAVAEREAREEHQRLLEEAERDAEKVLERARQEINGLTRAARLDLKKHAAELAVRLAEDRVRQEIKEEDHRRLFAGFISRLGERR